MNLSNRVRPEREPVTVEKIRAAHRARRAEIRARLREFEEVWRTADDARLWEELVYCIFTAGASARMGLGSVKAVRHLLARGVYPPPSQFEAWFLSGAHTDRDVKTTIAAARQAMKNIRRGRP